MAVPDLVSLLEHGGRSAVSDEQLVMEFLSLFQEDNTLGMSILYHAYLQSSDTSSRRVQFSPAIARESAHAYLDTIAAAADHYLSLAESFPNKPREEIIQDALTYARTPEEKEAGAVTFFYSEARRL